MPHYDTPDQSVLDLINSTIQEFHPELVEAQVTIDALMAFDDKGFPVKVGGYPAIASIKISSLKNRVKGFADAEIVFDKAAYDALSDDQRKGLIDHQLYYLMVKRDKEDNIKRDDVGRACLKMRKHDYQMGWFREIALRHKENSPEVYQAKLLWRNDGETFFPKV